MGIGEFLGRVTKYPQSVQGMIWDHLLQQLNETDEGLAQCESPIEQMLYLPLNELANSLINNEYASCASVLPQYPIECRRHVTGSQKDEKRGRYHDEISPG